MNLATLRPCHDCGTEILILKNVSTQKWMPVEDQANPNGNVRVDVYRKTADVLTGARLTEARVNGEPLSLAHHVTCPARERYRRPKNGTSALFDPEELQ